MKRDFSHLVGIVIVNWNQREITLDALRSVYASDYTEIAVIVVDNGSEDGSVEVIKAEFSDVIVIENEKNTGFAAASNQGMNRALEIGAEYIYFLNNDATISPDCITILVDIFNETHEVGAVAPFIMYHDNPDLIWYGGGIVRFWRGRIAHKYIRKYLNTRTFTMAETDYITGCAMMIRRKAVEQCGGFDLSFGIYSEDVDLSLRLRKMGWQLWVTPTAKAYHKVSVSSGGELSPLKAFHRGRSNAFLIKRWAKWWELPTLIFGGLIGGLLVTVKLLIGLKLSTVTALWRGIVTGLRGAAPHSRYKLDFMQ